MDTKMIALFGTFYVILFILIIYSIVRKSGKKIKINEEVSSKYKDIAYELIKDNKELNIQRRNHNILALIKGLFVIGIFCMFILISVIGPAAIIFMVILIITLIVIQLTTGKSNLIFDKILPDIIEKHYKDFKYDHSKGIDKLTYREARFEGFDRYRSDDLILGKVCGYDFCMSEVHTERRHTDKDGHTHYTTIFHGAFSKVTLNKDLGCFITIVNNRIKLFSKDYYITIDNEAFEKNYDVFTDDKIKVMRLLTPDVTTKMIDLYNETGIYCEVKIMNNLLYIRLYTGALFNLSFSNAEKEALMVGKSLAVIDSVFKIMENFIKEVEEFDV